MALLRESPCGFRTAEESCAVDKVCGLEDVLRKNALARYPHSSLLVLLLAVVVASDVSCRLRATHGEGLLRPHACTLDKKTRGQRSLPYSVYLDFLVGLSL